MDPATIAAPAILALFSYMSSRNNDPKKIDVMDKNQKKLYGDMSQGIYGQGPLASNFQFDPEAFKQFFNQTVAQPQTQAFERDVIPGITGAFRGQGLGQSSYAGQALSRAGTDLQQQLNQLMAQGMYQGEQDAMTRRLGAMGNLMQTPTFGYQKPQMSSFDALLSKMAGSAGDYVTKKLFG